jgi:glutathione peroxidase
MSTAPWELPLTMLDGRATTLGEWRGQALLIVNVASRCGMTPQYAGLEKLYRAHRDRGFTILGVPCDQFGHQEPGSAAEIAEFCDRTYGVSFPLLAKTKVNGFHTHPLYRWLKRERPAFLWFGTIKWNFTKFLVGRDGTVLKRYAPIATPESFADEVARAVAA